jgi:hypothetical protein
MEGDDGSDGADDRAFPFRIQHSADGVTEVVERRQQRGAAVVADAGDVSDEVDERPATRVARFIPLGGMPRRDDDEDVGRDEEEEEGMREREERDEDEEEQEEEEEEEGGDGSSEHSSISSEEEEGWRHMRPEKLTPASPRSPRGGHELVDRWNEKLRTARAAMEVLQPTEEAEKGWNKKKKKEPASAELPSEAELDAKVEFAILVNKVHSTRTKLRELTRLREQFRSAPLTSFKLRS